MIQVKKLILVLLAGCTWLLSAQAQSAIPATGGNASGSGGSVSFTVGQLVYSAKSGTSGTVLEGVQQPYEISVVTELEEAREINLLFTVYPNPATDFVTLKVEDYDGKSLSYWLYGIGGNLIETRKVLSDETRIIMGNRSPGTYFLKITSGSKEIKIFKIVKN